MIQNDNLCRDARLDQDPVFINSKKYGHNLYKLIENYPNGVPDKVICRVLQISQEELEAAYKKAIEKLQDVLN
jgi:hypothetical protein